MKTSSDLLASITTRLQILNQQATMILDRPLTDDSQADLEVISDEMESLGELFFEIKAEANAHTVAIGA